MAQLDRLSVRGFKSIRALDDFKLRRLNVLIGANGAGKSNFISLFRMLSEMMAGRLEFFVSSQDGPDALLHRGLKHTKELCAEFRFGKNGYEVTLAPGAGRLIFTRETTTFVGDYYDARPHSLGAGHNEARLPQATGDSYAPFVRAAIASWRVYHFHDTSDTAGFRQAQAVRDNLFLKPQADNLAPFLRFLKEQHPESYALILATVRQVAPFLRDFVYRPEPGERVELEWFAEGDPDTPRGPRQLSDGTLRFIALAALLLQPVEFRPHTILIDEPELGLHPFALGLLGALLRRASAEGQIVVSTQSAELVSELSPDDVVVVSLDDGASTFRRLDADVLKEWLADYSLGDLWKMNVLGGRPR